MIDEKYAVFKREDFDRAYAGRLSRAHVRTIDDAVVIRTQDVFAYSGLAAYANTIRTHMALLELHVGDDAKAMIQRLDEIATYFERCAHEAEDRIARGECKVPD